MPLASERASDLGPRCGRSLDQLALHGQRREWDAKAAEFGAVDVCLANDLTAERVDLLASDAAVENMDYEIGIGLIGLSSDANQVRREHAVNRLVEHGALPDEFLAVRAIEKDVAVTQSQAVCLFRRKFDVLDVRQVESAINQVIHADDQSSVA